MMIFQKSYLTSSLIQGDVVQISFVIGGAAEVSEKLAEKVTNNLNVENLNDKIEAEEDIMKIALCVESIAKRSEEVVEKLIPVVKKKIERAEKDSWKINHCIGVIGLGSEEFASKLVNQLDPENAKTPEVREKIIELKKQYQKT